MSVLNRSCVIDLGCYTHPAYPEDESVKKLIRRFKPDVLYGFDPHPDMEEDNFEIGDTFVFLFNSAMATYDGEIGYDPRPDRPLAASTTKKGPLTVDCIDFARWMVKVAERFDTVWLKMDVEGNEYALLEHLVRAKLDSGVKLLLVEWHDPPLGPDDADLRRSHITHALKCPVAEW